MTRLQIECRGSSILIHLERWLHWRTSHLHMYKPCTPAAPAPAGGARQGHECRQCELKAAGASRQADSEQRSASHSPAGRLPDQQSSGYACAAFAQCARLCNMLRAQFNTTTRSMRWGRVHVIREVADNFAGNPDPLATVRLRARTVRRMPVCRAPCGREVQAGQQVVPQ